jgi:hypothetical protein
MGIADGVAHLLEDGEEAAAIVGGIKPLSQQLVQRPSPDQFHRQEGPSIRESPQFVDGRDARVLQLAGDPGLGLETLRCRRLGFIVLAEHLDCYLTAEPKVPGAMDHAHAPAADLIEEFVAGQARGRWPGLFQCGSRIIHG